MKKSRHLVGLFTLAMLSFPLSGCNDKSDWEFCRDQNQDLLCDDDQSRVDPNSYVVVNGKKMYYIKEESLVSSGYKKTDSSYKSGIGKIRGSGG